MASDKLKEKYVLPNNINELIYLIKKIFNSNDVVLTKQQYIEWWKSSRITPEVQLWLDIFKLTVEDWMENRDNPTPDSARIAKEIEKWVFKNSFGMDMLSTAIYVAFRVEPEVFKTKFRKWLRQTRPIVKRLFTPHSIVAEPFETVCIQVEISAEAWDVTLMKHLT